MCLYYIRFLICILMICMTSDLGGNVNVNGEDISSGAEYLQNAIRDIQMKNAERNILTVIGNTNNNRRVNVRKKPTLLQRLKPYLIDINRRYAGFDQQEEHQLFQSDPPHPVYHPQEDHQPQSYQQTHSIFSSDPEPDPMDLQATNTQPHQQGHIPEPPSLTKGELAALYEAAVSSGNTVQLNNGINYHGTATGIQDALPVQAALHEIRGPHDQYSQTGQDAYYYYYYPLKTFLDGIVPQAPHYTNQIHQKEKYKSPILQTSHTHLHNVKVEPIKAVMEMTPHKQSKALEPLFMAISGLVGMAVMFMFTMVLFPRIKGVIKKKKGRQGRHIYPHTTMSDMSWTTLFNNFVENIENYECKTCNNINRYSKLLENFNSPFRRKGQQTRTARNLNDNIK